MVNIHLDFENISQWLEWSSSYHQVFDLNEGVKIAGRVHAKGFRHSLTGEFVSSDQIEWSNGVIREGLVVNGINSRQRAVIQMIAETLHASLNSIPRIFATEAVTPFALMMRGIFPRFLGSEYGSTELARQALYPIPHEDLLNLTQPDGMFDIVSTNEVLEHVPDIDQALRELCRVLRPGGWHIGTVPFRFMSKTGDVRSKFLDGQLVHLKEPEFHGNPVDPSGGALVFEVPGWDLLDRARSAGFSRAVMRFVASEEMGYISEHIGLFIFCAQK